MDTSKESLPGRWERHSWVVKLKRLEDLHFKGAEYSRKRKVKGYSQEDTHLKFSQAEEIKPSWSVIREMKNQNHSEISLLLH